MASAVILTEEMVGGWSHSMQVQQNQTIPTRSLRPNWFPCSARQEDSIWLCSQIKVKQLIVPLGAVDF